MTTKTHNQADADRSIRRIKSMLIEEMGYEEMAQTLNSEGYRTLTGKPWTAINLRVVIFRLRRQLKGWYRLAQRRANLTQEALA